MWHWGNVAEPCGPTRAPAWRGGDTWAIFIFIIYMFYNIYIGVPIIGRQIINSLIRRPLYTREFPFIFTVWTNSLISSKIYRWIKARDASRADTVDAKTTGSPINTRALKFT